MTERGAVEAFGKHESDQAGVRRQLAWFAAMNLLRQQHEPVKPLVGKGELVGEGEQPSGAGNRVACRRPEPRAQIIRVFNFIALAEERRPSQDELIPCQASVQTR